MGPLLILNIGAWSHWSYCWFQIASASANFSSCGGAHWSLCFTLSLVIVFASRISVEAECLHVIAQEVLQAFLIVVYLVNLGECIVVPMRYMGRWAPILCSWWFHRRYTPDCLKLLCTLVFVRF